MCGISGLIEPNVPNGNVLRASISMMTDTLSHRGPDSRGVWIDESQGVALGHRRLAIVDLSSAGNQPMVSSSGRYVLVYNGEIYNHPELRRELADRSCKFRGNSDSEVLLEAIETWGVKDAVNRCVGMFAFGLWDRFQRQLWLARDRLGIKPLYWEAESGRILFGSELKALMAFPRRTLSIDRDALSAFFRFQYVPAPRSVFKGIYKLQPGRLLRWSPGKEVAIEQFWDLRSIAIQGHRNQCRASDLELTDTLEDLLSQAVRCRLVADVPVGAFLSGGIDSSTIVALAQKQSNRPIKTFSIGFEAEEKNEAGHARAVAAYLGTDHTELTVQSNSLAHLVDSVPTYFDEPFADDSQIPTLLVSQLAREQVVVALSGDGGDEVFGGYPRYHLTSQIWEKLKSIPAFARPIASKVAQSLNPGSWDRLIKLLPGIYPGINGNRIHRLSLLFGCFDFAELYSAIITQPGEPEAFVVGSGKPGLVEGSDMAAEFGDSLELMQLIDMLTYLPEDILTKVDRATMSVGLEGRVPILDHRVVEYAWRLPRMAKVRGGVDKWLLRKVLHRHVPEHLVDRPKMGFSTPLGAWLRGPLHSWASDILDRNRLHQDGYLNTGLIQERWKQHQAGLFDWQHLIWSVLMFETWKNKWLS